VKEPATNASFEEEATPLRAEDTSEYCSFPIPETLREDGHDFLRRIRTDLRRLSTPAAVAARKDGLPIFRTASQEGSDKGMDGESTLDDHELWKSVEDRMSRLENEMLGLNEKVGSKVSPHLVDPVQLMQTTSAAMTRMTHDLAQLVGPVRECLRQNRKVTSDSTPMSRRLRLAESDLKTKEQRHALKVGLLEKRLGRLTSTLTSVQQETRRSLTDPPILQTLGLEGDLSDQPEEYRQFLELLSGRERELRRLERQVSDQQNLTFQMERQLVDLALGKFDAECAVTQARAEEDYWSNKAKEREEILKSTQEAAALCSLNINKGFFMENMFHAGGVPAFPTEQRQEDSIGVLPPMLGLPPAPAFCSGGPSFGMFMPPFGAEGTLPPPLEESYSEM
jgi:hypothetical protein